MSLLQLLLIKCGDCDIVINGCTIGYLYECVFAVHLKTAGSVLIIITLYAVYEVGPDGTSSLTHWHKWLYGTFRFRTASTLGLHMNWYNSYLFTDLQNISQYWTFSPVFFKIAAVKQWYTVYYTVQWLVPQSKEDMSSLLCGTSHEPVLFTQWSRDAGRLDSI